MKKNLQKFSLSIFLLVSVSAFSQTWSVSSSPITQCFTSGTVTAYVAMNNNYPGATSYSWSTNSSACNATITNVAPTGTGVTVAFGCCGVYTITCIAYNGTAAIAASAVNPTISCSPTISIINTNSVICAGATATACASGATSYTWLPNGMTGGCTVLSPSVSTCYSVVGSNGTCAATATSCILVNSSPSPTITVSNSNLCAGSSATLTGSGANTYIWLPSSASTSAIVVSPSVSTCYTLIGGNSSTGCSNMTTKCVTVHALPVITITPGFSLCAGSSATLNGSGAQSFTWSPFGGNMSQAIIAPLSNTCYTLAGYDGTCTGLAVSCVTAASLPVLNISGTSTVCLGSSVSFTASGALTYSWNTLQTTNTISFIPTGNSVIAVMGTDANGCVGTFTLPVTTNTNCSDVWPGDANSDGVVNSTDVLELGLAANSTGSARSPGGNSYVAQFANNWSGTISSGKNKCHADCNGDGTVNAADTVAIYNNYSLTHSFKESKNAVDPDINIISSTTYANAGMWNKADIMLGSTTSPVQTAGIAFDLNFDLSMIDNNSVYLVYTPSFLDNGGQNIIFRKLNSTTEKIYAATVRTDGNNANGQGKIGELYFKVKTGLPSSTVIDLSVSNATKTDKNGVHTSLTTGSVALAVNNTPNSIIENVLSQDISIFPNPGNNEITLRSVNNTEVFYGIYDVTGRNIVNGSFTNITRIDISKLSGGTYIVKLDDEMNTCFKKLIVE